MELDCSSMVSLFLVLHEYHELTFLLAGEEAQQQEVAKERAGMEGVKKEETYEYDKPDEKQIVNDRRVSQLFLPK